MIQDRDLVYAHRDGIDLRLDVFRPLTTPQRAAILFFHGGGWRAGSRAAMHPDAEAMAAQGYVGLAVQYRLLGEAPFPAQIQDVKAAIRWARAHADELDIDPARIILWGSSAGAHLSLLAAGTGEDPVFDEVGPAPDISAAVAAVIAVHPPVAFHLAAPEGRHTTPATGLLGEAATAEDARRASPLHWVGPDFPPTLLLHGTSDRLVNHAASQALFDALRAAGAPADLHLFTGHNHGFAAIPSVRALATAQAAYFLDRILIDPDGYRTEAETFSIFARRAAS